MEVEKIYFDMDGVLADFDRGVAELCGLALLPAPGKRGRLDDDRMWAEIRKVDRFYDRLELMPGAKELFDAVYGKYKDRCEILTGVPKPDRGIPEAGECKVAWTRRLLSKEIRVNLVLRKEKLRYCQGPGTILIDDLEKTIHSWQEAGGTGILHRDAEDTLRRLEALDVL